MVNFRDAYDVGLIERLGRDVLPQLRDVVAGMPSAERN
jgi:hypothetical protein